MDTTEIFESRNKAMKGVIIFLKAESPKCFKCQYYLRFFEKGLPLEAVIILSKLLDWEGKQFDKRNFYIYKTINELKKETGLNRYKQTKGINLLKQYKLIEVVKKGIPAKRHFLLDFTNLVKFVVGEQKPVRNNSVSLFKEGQQV